MAEYEGKTKGGYTDGKTRGVGKWLGRVIRKENGKEEGGGMADD